MLRLTRANINENGYRYFFQYALHLARTYIYMRTRAYIHTHKHMHILCCTIATVYIIAAVLINPISDDIGTINSDYHFFDGK